jgi:RNA polymerase sigma-70 factor (ECF subfamily)
MNDPDSQLCEQILVLRCQTGDEVAFTELVERHGRRLSYYLQKSFGRLDGAADAYQDVWFLVFRRIRQLSDPAAFTTWLYRIARNRACQELRRIRPRTSPITEAEEMPAPDVEEAEFTPEDCARIHTALDELALEHREVLMLRFLEGMTYEQVAAVTGCGVGTVKSRLHYAKRSLRRVLEGVKVNG